MVRTGVHRLNQNPEEPEQDGHLDNQGAQTANRIDARLAVESHCFLGHPLPVSPVAFLNLSHPRLQVHHGPHLPQLLDGQRQCDQSNNDSENDDCHTHVVEADGVEHHQQVQHRANDYLSPEIVDTQEGLPRRQGWAVAPSPWTAVQIADQAQHHRQSSSCFQQARAVNTDSENCSCTSTRRALPSSEPT